MDKLIQNERDGGGGRRMWPGGVRRQMQATEENAGRFAGTSVSLEDSKREGERGAGIGGVQPCGATDLLNSRL